MITALVLAVEPDHAALRKLERELAELQDDLAARELAIGDLRTSLMSFEGRYIRQVGILYKQLDGWNAKREELHKTKEPATALEPDEDLPEPVAPLDLRQLFRELAKRIHPDHAINEADADRRTRLMAQASEAFRRFDRATLERMLHGHDNAGWNARRITTAATLEAQLAALREDLAAADAEWHSLAGSELAQLREGVLTAAREGRDLLAEMAIRVQGLIGIAMRAYELDLDRIKRPNRGLDVNSLLSAEAPPLPTLRYDAKLRRWIR